MKWHIARWTSDGKRIVISDGIGDICLVDADDRSEEIAEEHARLIAAAPDLLEACVVAKAVLTGEVRDDVERGAPSGAALNMLAAAIVKARGKR